MPKRKDLVQMTVKELRQKMQSKLLTSLREGLSSIRMAEFLKKIMLSRGQDVGDTGCILLLQTGNQCTIAGSGKIFDHFQETGQVMNYGGSQQKPVSFYDDDFEEAAYRIMKFDQTFYRMPYDCRKSVVFDPEQDFLFQKRQPQKANKRKGKKVASTQARHMDCAENSDESDDDCNDKDSELLTNSPAQPCDNSTHESVTGVFLKSDHIPPPNRVKRKIIEYQDETELAPKYCKRQITSAKRKTCKSQVTNVLTLQDASVHETNDKSGLNKAKAVDVTAQMPGLHSSLENCVQDAPGESRRDMTQVIRLLQEFKTLLMEKKSHYSSGPVALNVSHSNEVPENFQHNFTTISYPDLLDIGFDLCSAFNGDNTSNGFVLNTSFDN